MLSPGHMKQRHPIVHRTPHGQIHSLKLILVFGVALATAWRCTHRPDPLSATPRCSNSVQATVSAAKPTVSVAYTEPSANKSGDPLKELANTTIYYDLGAGRILAKKVPASKPTGGGQVSQSIAVPGQSQTETLVRICVTATDRHGNESSMTP